MRLEGGFFFFLVGCAKFRLTEINWFQPARRGCQRWWRTHSRWAQCFLWALEMWWESRPPASVQEPGWSPCMHNITHNFCWMQNSNVMDPAVIQSKDIQHVNVIILICYNFYRNRLFTGICIVNTRHKTDNKSKNILVFNKEKSQIVDMARFSVKTLLFNMERVSCVSAF